MNVTRTDGVTKCKLSKTERATLDRASVIIEQLAFHGRPKPALEQLATDVGFIARVGLDAPIDEEETTEA